METMKAWTPQNMTHFQELQQMIWDQMGAAMTSGMPQPDADKKTK
jgi:hypothetical protein